MKKTLVALTVAAFAASSAQAVTVLNAEGTKVDFEGSLRVILEQAGSKTHNADGVQVSRTERHAKLRNEGSRFGVKVKHDLAKDLYALGRVEFRFNKNTTDDQWGDLYAHRAYVGLGSQQYGEIAFGRQDTIADDVSQTKDYAYGLLSKGDYIATNGKQVIRYDYRGYEGLHLSANYNFADSRYTVEHEDVLSGAVHADEVGNVVTGSLQNAYGVGALYNVDNLDLRIAYGHQNYKTATNKKSRQDAVLFSAGYTVDNFKFIVDTGYRASNKEGVKGNAFYVAPGVVYNVTDLSSVYGNYLYERETVKDASKAKTHGFLLGTDYKFHKQVVAFVEGAVKQTKDYTKVGNGYNYNKKTTDKAIGVGLRVYW